MNWPNKISMVEPVFRTERTQFWKFREKLEIMEKWCLDNLSSVNVLWTIDNNHIPGQPCIWSFYFAQSQDAVLFRLVNGV